MSVDDKAMANQPADATQAQDALEAERQRAWYARTEDREVGPEDHDDPIEVSDR